MAKGTSGVLLGGAVAAAGWSAAEAFAVGTAPSLPSRAVDSASHSLRGGASQSTTPAATNVAAPVGLAALAAAGVVAQQARTKGRAVRAKRDVKVACRAAATLKEADNIPATERDRALDVNLDPTYYGSFAEIGAGQEVSRWFLRAGAAAGTVARTVSAYDMAVSDRMYGNADRYVTKERMMQMCQQEYTELEETLREQKGVDCRFFAYASTLAAKAYMSDRECEGWIGILYQKEPGQEPSRVYMHVRMTDPTAEMQGDALGILGMNLVYLCKDATRPARTIIKHLLDDVGEKRLSINQVSFEGPGWVDVDQRLVALWLVQYKIAEAVVFEPQEDGSFAMSMPNVSFYKRPMVVQRGRFRFVSKTNEAIFDASLKKLAAEAGETSRAPTPVIEITMDTLGNSEAARLTDIPEEVERDFVSRFNVCASLGQIILVSGLGPMHKLGQYLIRYTNQQVVIAVGGGQYSIMRGIFRNQEAKGLSGGLLEAFGKLFSKGLQMYVFPNVADDGAITDGLEKQENRSGLPAQRYESQKTLLQHLVATNKIVPIEEEYIDKFVLDADTNAGYRLEISDILDKICRLDGTWKELVPPKVVGIVERKGLNEVLGALEFSVDGSSRNGPLERMVRTFRGKDK